MKSVKRSTAPQPKLTLVLHNIRSVLNVGSMFRTADAVGVGLVVLAGYTPGPDTHPDRITKTALGAQATVPWVRATRVGDALRRMRRAGVRVLALEVGDGATDYRAFKPVWPLALVVGNEVEGVGAIVSHNVDGMIQIPMRGTKESLNVAVAAGIALYELTRRWK